MIDDDQIIGNSQTHASFLLINFTTKMWASGMTYVFVSHTPFKKACFDFVTDPLKHITFPPVNNDSHMMDHCHNRWFWMGVWGWTSISKSLSGFQAII